MGRPARTCGACRAVLRFDERLQTCQLQVETSPGVFELQSSQACNRCRGESDEPTVYPVGSPVPLINRGGSPCHLPICGLCRLALFEDDWPQAMRLHEDDVEGTGIEPGAYHACRDCVEKYKPAIARRLGKPLARIGRKELM